MAKIRPEILLQEAATALKKTRPTMSLRAVAARLEISPSYWSKILKGQKPLPQHLISKVVKVLAMDTQQVAALQRAILDVIEDEHLAPATGLRATRSAKESPVEGYKNLGREDFWIIDEWFYLAILNLFTVADFAGTVAEIADRLALRTDQVVSAVRRLSERGFLKEKKGGFELTNRQVRLPTDRSYGPVRKYHRQVLKKAHAQLAGPDAAENFEGRLISAICFAGSSAKLIEARLILEEAAYRAANLMADGPSPDQVYQLGLQLFPLTKPTKE